MESKGILDHTIVHGVFVGLARSGKDSLMKRLLRKKLSSKSPSTGVAENTVQVKVMKKSTTVAANIEESYWTEMDYDDEAIKLMSISIHSKVVSPEQLKELPIRYQEGILIEASVTMPVHSIESALSSTSLADGGDNHHTGKARGRGATVPAPPLSSKTIHQSRPVFPVPNPAGILKGALQSKGLQALKQHFQKTWSLYLTNTGGQIEFQEVLPLLVSGPSVFFFTFRLDRDLNEHYSVEYELATGDRSYPYTTTCTTVEGILQTLASISAMGTFVYHDLQKRKAPLRPKVFFIGTHKDQLDPASAASQIASIDRQLKEVIKSTSHYKELVEYASRSQLIFTVNNFSDSDSDFQSIRSAVERVVVRGEFQMSSPAHWLVFSLALRKLDCHVVNYDHCFDIAKRCGITSQKEFDEALHFIHSKMGMIRYFPYENIKNLVIIDPQFLFDKVTDLIVDTFTFEKAGMSKMDEFKHKGIFSMDEFELTNIDSQLEITTSQLGDLLVHLRIAAPFQINGEKKLFLPCVLAHAKISTEASRLSTPVSSLLIVFDCGYIPKGVPGALIKYLMTNEMKSPSEWLLLTDEIFRDQISFSVGAYDIIVLKIFPTHFEINCIPDEQFTDDRAISIEEACDEVLKAINVAIPQIMKDLNYIKGHHMLTFQCQAPNCKHKHKTQVVMDKRGRSGALFCHTSKKRFKLPSNSYYWGYGEKPHQELGTENVATQPSNSQIASMQPTSCDMNPLSAELQSTTLPEKSIDTHTASSGIDSQIPLREEHHLVIFEQLQKHSSHWMDISRYLGFFDNELRNIQMSPSHIFSGPPGWLSAMLQEWLQWAPGDSRGSNNFATLESLKSALSKAGFGATARSLHI
jgi:GTPase SAR1 family protein